MPGLSVVMSDRLVVGIDNEVVVDGNRIVLVDHLQQSFDQHLHYHEQTLSMIVSVVD